MRTLTETLLEAQKAATRTPYIKVEARNTPGGVVNLKWERLYTGTEPDGPHALTIAGDGSLIRLRATPVSDGRKLYLQRVIAPGAGSDFSPWTYLNQYNVMAVAACSLGAEVSYFRIKSDGEIARTQSPDSGATWPTTDYPGYAPTGAGVTQAAAAYKPNGDLALFFTDTGTLYLIKRISGAWQTRIAWDKTTGNLSGAAVIYDPPEADFKLLISGQDTSGNYKLWSLVYGDGGEVTAGTWSDLKEITSAPSDGSYSFAGLFLDKIDGACRAFFSEIFSGSETYQRPFRTHTLPGSAYLENRWREPVPFDATSENGLAIAHGQTQGSAPTAWITLPAGVWRAEMKEKSLDLSSDILVIKKQLTPNSGELTIELHNNDGKYNSPGAGPLAILDHGCQIDFSPGYRTTAGNEYSTRADTGVCPYSFTLEAYEHNSSPGKASLIIYTTDGWKALEKWIARYQFRWNNPAISNTEASVTEIITQVLARSGIKLEVISQSTMAAGFYPDFTIHPGDNGKAAIARLLSFIPDILFLEGNTAYLLNPQAADAAIYNYGTPASGEMPPTEHIILEGRYRTGAWKNNRIRIEGPGILTESFAWDEIEKQGDILDLVEDLNLTTAAGAHDRGDAILRKNDMEHTGGMVRIPVNCGQQLYDVIEITDPGAGLAAAKRRVLGIELTYNPARGIYEQKLQLGGM